MTLTDHLITATVSVLLAIVGLAALAVLLSKNAQTSGVLGAGSNAFSQALCVALSPVTGSGVANLASNLTGSSGGCGGLIPKVSSCIQFAGQSVCT